MAWLTWSAETSGAKGTLYYMAPEQFEGKPITAATDVFSLGVVCFETLTRRRPFVGANPDELRTAILKGCPPAVSSLNPAVSAALSQVIHAAMAKKPHNRFSSAREFGECLKKALRNEPIERFEPGKLQLRLSRVESALESSQFEVAGDILSEIEEEGYLHPNVNQLRSQVDQALRNRDIRQFLESARRFDAQEEYTLALQKVQDALQLEAVNAEALELRSVVEAKRSSQQIGNWLNLAQRHLSNLAFEPAREAVSSVLHLHPTDVTALRLMTEISRVEQEVVRKREDKERFFDSAVELRKKGDLTAALSRLQRVLELDRQAPDPVQPERGASFQKFYNEVRPESEAIRNAFDEAKKELEAKNYPNADHICATFLEKYPNHALFQALKFDIGERQRQDLSAYIAEVDRTAEAEPDLDRKAKLLEQALSRYPDEPHFERALKGTNAKRDLINGLVSQARNLEDRGQYSEAIDKWEMLRSIYHRYPGLEFEVDRIRRRLEQHTGSEAKTRWIERIDGALNSGDYASALKLVEQALVESPQDAQLVPLERLVRQRAEQSQQAQHLVEHGQKLLDTKSFDEALKTLERAHTLDEHNVLIRAIYIEAILGKASAIIDADLPAAEKLIDSAFGLDATNARVNNMRVLASDRKRSTAIDQHLSRARELQATNELRLALAEVEEGLLSFPGEASLIQLQSSLEGAQKQSEVRKDRGAILKIRKRLDGLSDDSVLASLSSRASASRRSIRRTNKSRQLPPRSATKARRQNAQTVIVTPDKTSGDEPAEIGEFSTSATGSTESRRKGDSTFVSLVIKDRKFALIITVAAILIVTGVVIDKAWHKTPVVKVEAAKPNEPVLPPPALPIKTIGMAIARSAVSVLKDRVESSINVVTLNVEDPVEMLESTPPSPNANEWVLVQPPGQPANRGYVHLGDLNRIQTGDHHFDLMCALASITKSTDPAEVQSRLDGLSFEDHEADDVYLQLSQAYVHLAELTIVNKKAARAALDMADDYFKRAESLQPTDPGQNLLASIRRLENQLKQSDTGQPSADLIPKLLASANTAYQKGMALEGASKFTDAVKQYSVAKGACDQILARGPNAG